jgi:hypothetical protein
MVPTPVAYKSHGEEVTIKVELPVHKKWWRNFVDHNGPISDWLQGVERPGKATAMRDAWGTVRVNIASEPAA